MREAHEPSSVYALGIAVTDQLDRMIAYEQGELSYEDSITLFQELIDSGLVWKLQGSYGRTASALIDAGECTNGRP